MPGLLQRVAEVHHDVVAMRAKEGDQWVEWTYGALLDQVTPAFIDISGPGSVCGSGPGGGGAGGGAGGGVLLEA